MPCSVQQTHSHKSQLKPYRQPPLLQDPLILKAELLYISASVNCRIVFVSVCWLHIFRRMMCGMSLSTTRKMWLTPKHVHTHSNSAVDLVLGCVDWWLTHVCQTHAVFHRSAHSNWHLFNGAWKHSSSKPLRTHAHTHTHTHTRLRDTAFVNMLFPAVTVSIFSCSVQMCLLQLLCPNIYFWLCVPMCTLERLCPNMFT